MSGDLCIFLPEAFEESLEPCHILERHLPWGYQGFTVSRGPSVTVLMMMQSRGPVFSVKKRDFWLGGRTQKRKYKQ